MGLGLEDHEIVLYVHGSAFGERCAVNYITMPQNKNVALNSGWSTSACTNCNAFNVVKCYSGLER